MENAANKSGAPLVKAPTVQKPIPEVLHTQISVAEGLRNLKLVV
jgi:hypothetical protein